MKQLTGLLVAIILFASCREQESSNSGGSKVIVPPTCNLRPPVMNSVLDSVLINIGCADSLISNYHYYITKTLGQQLKDAAFMINARALRQYLNSDTTITTLDLYMARNDTGSTLVYIGAYDSAGITVEKPYIMPGDPSNTQWIMDQTIPCPTCDRLRFYNPGDEKGNAKK